MTPKQPIAWMEYALALAAEAATKGEVPVAAVIINSASKEKIAEAHNEVEVRADPTAHAELLAIRGACEQLGTPRLVGYEMIVTLEPCPMCAQAISFARLDRVCFAAYDAKGGGVDHGARIFAASSCHHQPEIIGGIKEEAAGKLLQQFFQNKR
jgi:tRNA(adenine34) deaminase